MVYILNICRAKIFVTSSNWTHNPLDYLEKNTTVQLRLPIRIHRCISTSIWPPIHPHPAAEVVEMATRPRPPDLALLRALRIFSICWPALLLTTWAPSADTVPSRHRYPADPTPTIITNHPARPAIWKPIPAADWPAFRHRRRATGRLLRATRPPLRFLLSRRCAPRRQRLPLRRAADCLPSRTPGPIWSKRDWSWPSKANGWLPAELPSNPIPWFTCRSKMR